jgi:hypothetical protein
MTTWTTEDREALEKGLDFFKKLREADKEPIPFAGWVDKEDTETMLREQIYAQQLEINRLNEELTKAKKEKNV